MSQSKSVVYLLVVASMIIWGFNVTAIKILVTHFPPMTITAIRVLVGFLAMSPILFYGKLFRKLTKKELAFIVCTAATGMFGHHLFLSVGLAKTAASNTGLIIGAAPLLTAVFAAIMLKERFTIHRFLGILFGISGVAVIVLAGNEEGLRIRIGDLYVVVAVVSQAISYIFIKMVSRTVDVRLITGLSMLMGALLLFTASLSLETTDLSLLFNVPLYVWIIFFASGTIATGVIHVIYNNAIKHIGPTETALFLNITPFFAVISAYLFLGEAFVVAHLLGFVLIVTGVIFGSGVVEQFILRRTAKTLEG